MNSGANRPRCPGQDMRYWKPDDIFYMKCQKCGNEIEFWKDEPFLLCRKCGHEMRNPRIDLGCAKWCKYADQCLGKLPEFAGQASPIVDKVKAALSAINDNPSKIELADKICRRSDLMLFNENADPCVVKTAAMILCLIDDKNSIPAKISDILDKAEIKDDLKKSISDLVNAVLGKEKKDSLEFKAVLRLVKEFGG